MSSKQIYTKNIVYWALEKVSYFNKNKKKEKKNHGSLRKIIQKNIL